MFNIPIDTVFIPCIGQVSVEQARQILNSDALIELERLRKACEKYDYHGDAQREAFKIAIKVVEKGGKI